MTPRLVMFDLDGTLVDSVPDLALAVDAMLADMGQTPAGAEQVRLWVGNGAQMLVRRALSKSMQPGEIEESLFVRALQRFFHHYENVNGSLSRLYPGVSETVSLLRKYIPYLAVVTNKPEQFTRPLLAQLELPHFDMIVSGDSLSAKKPDPAQLLYCLDELECQSHEALMVGDSSSDIKASKAASIACACVTYGYHQGQDLSALQPEYVIDHFAELLNIIPGIAEHI